MSATSETQKLDSSRIAQAAQLLVRSRTNGTHLTGLSPELMPGVLSEAYEIQAAVARLRATDDAAFKLGLTSESAQRAADTYAPIVGRLGATEVHRGDTRIELPPGHLRVVEAEIVFEVGSDLRAAHAPFSERRVFASLCAAFAGIELCDTRFAGSDDWPIALVVADNSNADRLVVGDRLTNADLYALSNSSVTLELGGKRLVRGNTGNVLGHPLRAVTWLANWLARRGEGLRKGQLISSGSCTGLTEAAAKDIVVATFGSGARVILELAQRAPTKVRV